MDWIWPTAGAKVDEIWPHMTLSVWESVCQCVGISGEPLKCPRVRLPLGSAQVKCDRRFMLEINPTLNGIQFEHSI